MATPGSHRERGRRPSAKRGGLTVLLVAFVLTSMAHLLVSCGTADSGVSQSLPLSAHGKRLTIVVNSGCGSDNEGFCSLSVPALKVQLDKNIFGNGVFSAVTNDRPDLKLTVVVTKLDVDEGAFIWSSNTYLTEAKFKLSDNTGKVVFSGKATGESSKAEEAVKNLAANLAAKMK
jgi:hypothetical protein